MDDPLDGDDCRVDLRAVEGGVAAETGGAESPVITLAIGELGDSAPWPVGGGVGEGGGEECSVQGAGSRDTELGS